MKLILKCYIKPSCKTKDFEINPLTNNLITVGEKLIFYNDEYKETKCLKRKISFCDSINYIKEENQLFASSTFYITNNKNEVYKCDSSTKKIMACIFKPSATILSMAISPLGKIVYINSSDSTLYLIDTLSNKKLSLKLSQEYSNNYSVCIYNENIILKNRKTDENSNNIKIFTSDLEEISNITSLDNNIFMKLVGINLLTTKFNGYLEIWDASTSEIYDYKHISDYKITYLTNDDEWFYFGNSMGEIIVTNDKFKVINKIQIFKSEVKKLIYQEDTLYALSEDGEIATLLIVDDDNTSVIGKFMKMYNIHPDYTEFFTTERVSTIENFIKKLNMNKKNYAPHESNIFKAFETSLFDKKICIIGKDPYYQYNIATGLAFEIKTKSWGTKLVNKTLKNILKLLYFSYNNEYKDIADILLDIEVGKFKILPPDKLFKSWESQGVLLLNSALTVEIGESGSHHKFWDNIFKDLIKYISLKNPNITYLIWGKDAAQFGKYILSGKKIIHNHPANAGMLDNPKDFLYGKSFIETKNIINWLGGTKIE